MCYHYTIPENSLWLLNRTDFESQPSDLTKDGLPSESVRLNLRMDALIVNRGVKAVATPAGNLAER